MRLIDAVAPYAHVRVHARGVHARVDTPASLERLRLRGGGGARFAVGMFARAGGLA
jgi:hypothetical protein